MTDAMATDREHSFSAFEMLSREQAMLQGMLVVKERLAESELYMEG